jgi:uncharacterized protein (TIGR03435 family)
MRAMLLMCLMLLNCLMLLTCLMLLACLILLNCSPAAAQTFEAASVKPAEPYKGGPIHIATNGGPGTDDPTRLTFSNATLAMILQTAFDLRDTQKVNGPDWMNIDMFDVAATLPPDATKNQMRAMLQDLLAERFHMTWHGEKQNLPAYILTTAKGRMRLRGPTDISSGASRKETSVPGIRTITCVNCTVGQFVRMLGHPQGRLIFDETGLTGTYDFALTYEPEYGVCKGCVMGGTSSSAPPAPPPPGEAPPVLSIALSQQLGLKLEKKQRPVDVIVIDHIDRVPASK